MNDKTGKMERLAKWADAGGLFILLDYVLSRSTKTVAKLTCCVLGF